jgi:nucleoside-diphosphate-sugar epimerase
VKVLVLGGTRFLGPFVVDELLSRGHQVALLSRHEADHELPVRLYEGDASDPKTLQQAVGSWHPEGLIDMLHNGPDWARSVVCACAGNVQRSVHLSCAAVYGRKPYCPVDEATAVVDPKDAPPEVAAKIAADDVILEAAARDEIPAVVLRLAELYGPRDPRCAEWYFARRALDGRPCVALPDSGLQICHRGFVQNMARGVVQALTAPRASGQVYNLGEEKLYTLAQLAAGIARALDHKWDIYSVPGNMWTTPYAYTSFSDIRKARSQLRYRDQMIPRDGLELTMTWLTQHPRAEDWSYPGIEDPFSYAHEDALIEAHGVKLES